MLWCDYVPFFVSILLVTICSIGINFRNKLDKQKFCGPSGNNSCADGQGINFGVLIFGLIVGILYLVGSVINFSWPWLTGSDPNIALPAIAPSAFGCSRKS